MPAPSDTSAHSSLQDQAIAWLVCLRDEDLSDAELEAFADWLDRDPQHAEAFAAAENLFKQMVVAGTLSGAATAKQPFPRQTAPMPCRVVDLKPSATYSPARLHRPWFAASLAIAALCLLTIGVIMPKQSQLLRAYFSDFRTQTGEISDIQLSDGSHLLMNTNSAISVAFSADARRIVLHHGQVRFTVAKDAQRPFEVLADDLTVRALGTVFEVYKTADYQTDVTVQEHAVAVSTAQVDQDTERVTVVAGQGLSYKPGLPLPRPQAVRAEQSAWHQHRLIINDQPLADLIAELERYRFGRIFLADASLENLRVTGVFSLDAPDEVLASVRKALALQETRIGPWWVLLHR
jgi:transmembrane sensor